MKEKVTNRTKINKSDNQQNETNTNGFIKSYKPDAVKEKLIKRLQFHLGNVKKSCDECGLSRATYYDWYNNDSFFRQCVDDIHEGVIDFVESSLQEQIKEGNITAIIFFLKTKGKKRGYIEKQELDINNNNAPDLSNLTSEEIIQILKLADGEQ
jgi:predicted DNA-binding transcriptional regulator AlpA